MLYNAKRWHEGEFLTDLRCTAYYHTYSHIFNDNLLLLRRGKGGQICQLVQWACAVTCFLSQFLQRWWIGKIKHNAFSRLPGATNASKSVFMFYYILNFSTLKTITEIAFSQRIFLQGMYFKFTVFFSDVFVHVLQTPCFKKNIDLSSHIYMFKDRCI